MRCFGPKLLFFLGHMRKPEKHAEEKCLKPKAAKARTKHMGVALFRASTIVLWFCWGVIPKKTRAAHFNCQGFRFRKRLRSAWGVSFFGTNPWSFGQLPPLPASPSTHSLERSLGLWQAWLSACGARSRTAGEIPGRGSTKNNKGRVG